MVHYVREKTFEFAADARDIWPAIAQTNLVSEIFGTGRYEAVDELQPDGSVLRRARGTKMRPMAKAWTEDLGEWVFARFCRQRRWFGATGTGGDQAVEYTVELEQDGPTTRVRIRIEVRAASPATWATITSTAKWARFSNMLRWTRLARWRQPSSGFSAASR